MQAVTARSSLARICMSLCGVLLLAACANMDTVKNAPPDQGLSRAFDASYDRTTAATLKALSSLNVNITNAAEDSSGTTYLVSKPMSMFSWGEVGRVRVQRSSAPPTLVFVDWRKRDTVQITGTGADEFSSTLFAEIAKSL